MAEVKIVLNEILKERNMTQLKLSNLTGIRYESISNLNKNKTERLSLIHLQKIMTVLEITDVGMLLKYEDDTIVEPVIEPATETVEDPLDANIEMLDLPYAVYNRLRKQWSMNFETVGDIAKADLSKARGIGPKYLQIINDALEKYLNRH
ncbi:helix-turn-helix transcriptional regulator [Sporosarcina sp. FSL K6-1508]|uniref:helix-turn-helix transcriptional regulator n=1 Tax=Sporosarcina sp. FSL K6-1508 TaxID=2921553 RepID=UPI0030F7197E